MRRRLWAHKVASKRSTNAPARSTRGGKGGTPYAAAAPTESVYIAELFVVAQERGHGFGELLLREALWSVQYPLFRVRVYN